ncbi:Sterol desaturase [Candidatus Terasakiella magnetica]|uniref:Sterol desaturase n=1 Tax=Candidatus Terasakiella magnetica TaxID=1867952 RepID=A0A1C3RC87_9PROT|nr:sterol desaturase family protein [Candidatus Terasakiella magnetica]SCA54897.1 Sterol desaturase [Candidatus Terasakiella magnetica]
MSDFIQENEAILRLSVFMGLFVLFAVGEALFPRLKRKYNRTQRWFANLSLMACGGLIVRIFLPFVPVAVAYYVQEQGGSLISLNTGQGPYLIFLGIILLDLCIYFQHVVMHKVPILWRLHKVHHTDLDFDVTTGLRFHPAEIVLSLLYKIALVVVFGIDPLAVIIFEMSLNAMAMFNHANLKLPLGFDRMLRLVFVTPDMHRVHHSQIKCETDSNYGFCVSFWDRLFKTYRDQPSKGHEAMEIGLNEYREAKYLKLIELLIMPFRR